jgi:hypothetical protein
MPKNWSKYEEEIRRLYTEEGKPLKVRQLMIIWRISGLVSSEEHIRGSSY